MKKIILLLLAGFMCIGVKVFAQDTMSHCDCFNIQDTPVMKYVPFTLGPDTAAKPPYYYNNLNTTPKLKLPFNFNFYGKNYDSVYIGNKGNITFIKPIHQFTTGNFPAGTDTAMIAPFWAHISNIAVGPEPPRVGLVFYKMYPHRLEVIWSDVYFYRFDCDIYDSFTLVISDGSDPKILGGNNLAFCYSTMEWACADSSGGSMGFGGTPATVGINKGDKTGYALISRFNLPGASFYGRDSTDNGTYWLENKQFIFNTAVTGENIPPVIINPDFCDTIGLCAWDTAEYTMNYICAVKGQTATFTATCPTLAPVTVSSVMGANGIYSVKVKASTNSFHVGYNTVTVTATDNSTPSQSISYPIVFNVGVCTGVNEVQNNDNSFTVYPNSNNGAFTLELGKNLTPENCVIKIYNMLGQEVYSEGIMDYQTSVNIASQPKGMYFIKLLKNNIEVGAKKIVLQ